jgi:DNA repair exonuclease SbcCD ATPase subunit
LLENKINNYEKELESKKEKNKDLQNDLDNILEILESKNTNISEQHGNLLDLQDKNNELQTKKSIFQQRPSQTAYQKLKKQKDKQQDDYQKQVKNLKRKRDTAQTEWDTAQRDLVTERNNHANTTTLLTNAINTIAKAQNNLGIVDLNNLPNMNGKTLIQLVNHKCPTPPSHTCPPCSLIHLPTPHVCPIVNKIECSHEDYEQIKRE